MNINNNLSSSICIRRKVVTESVHKDEVYIISGITEGENIVIKDGIYFQ